MLDAVGPATGKSAGKNEEAREPCWGGGEEKTDCTASVGLRAVPFRHSTALGSPVSRER